MISLSTEEKESEETGNVWLGLLQTVHFAEYDVHWYLQFYCNELQKKVMLDSSTGENSTIYIF